MNTLVIHMLFSIPPLKHKFSFFHFKSSFILIYENILMNNNSYECLTYISFAVYKGSLLVLFDRNGN